MKHQYHNGAVNRWHSNPWLKDIGDTVAAHCSRVADMVLEFDPNATFDVVKVALRHDHGEAYTGDLPKPFKDSHPDIKAAILALEIQYIERHGDKLPVLSDRELVLIKLCDCVDAYLTAHLHRPDYVNGAAEWRVMMGDIHLMATELGLVDTVETYMEGAMSW